MEAYVYIRVQPGAMGAVLTGLAAQPGIRRAVAVIGEWDVIAHIEGPELATIATQVISEIQRVEGVTRTLTAAVVPPDRVGIAGWGAPQAPAVIADACYVHIRAETGAVSGLAERLSNSPTWPAWPSWPAPTTSWPAWLNPGRWAAASSSSRSTPCPASSRP